MKMDACWENTQVLPSKGCFLLWFQHAVDGGILAAIQCGPSYKHRSLKQLHLHLLTGTIPSLRSRCAGNGAGRAAESTQPHRALSWVDPNVNRHCAL